MVKDVNCRRINLKRKTFSRGTGQRFKRFKRTPKYIKDNPENQVARQKEKDVFDFSDSEDDGADDLGMGLDLTDLQLLEDDPSEKQKQIIALTQDSVRPFFSSEEEYDENKLKEALTELKYSSFRGNQEETIKRILFGRSTLFISPTGSGKSLCYQLPALLYWRYKKYMTIVVSPLISLMEDQMSSFPSCLTAVCIHSGHSQQQRRNAIQQVANGEAQVVFLSPEAIVGGILELDDLKNLPPVGFVCIDEAHCLSEWSQNFRPAYLQFFEILNEQLSIKTFLGLTATASRATTFAISRCLTINPETDVIGSTTVPKNLILSVSYESNKEKALITLLQSPTFVVLPSIIVYCNRREETENVASLIRTRMQNYSSLVDVPERVKRGGRVSSTSSPPDKKQMKLTWNSEAYHAGLTTDTRKKIQRQFTKGEIRVVVATVAFGMGINKSNVRAVIHYDMPSSFESYVQEVGRAGRDGSISQCHMFLKSDKTDIFYQQRNIYASVVEKENIRNLVGYLFKPCNCARRSSASTREKLDKMNRNDPHEISSWQKTSFTDTPSQCNDDDLDEFGSTVEDRSEKENKPIKYVRKSLVRKHRDCPGHERSFSIDEAIEAVNLSPESLITFICQLQQAYPQLRIKQLPPIKAICSIFCHKGAKQMQALEVSCPAVRMVLFHKKTEHKRTSSSDFEYPCKLSFSITDVALWLGKQSSDVIKMLKKTEWELDDKTGKFRRSQIRVTFDGNAFHLMSVGDLTEVESNEVHKFLLDYMEKYQTVERNKVARVYSTFKEFSIEVEQMKDKLVRLDTSLRLKTALNNYFNPTHDQYIIDEANSNKEVDLDSSQLSSAVEAVITKTARDFISGHGTIHAPRAIAKILQGISCPNYPAEVWGLNKRWWRKHPDVDFLKLLSIIKNEFIKHCGKVILEKKVAPVH